jgi:hypothetical protein
MLNYVKQAWVLFAMALFGVSYFVSKIEKTDVQ